MIRKASPTVVRRLDAGAWHKPKESSPSDRQ